MDASTYKAPAPWPSVGSSVQVVLGGMGTMCVQAYTALHSSPVI
jgi:hypothetical protein